jgi:hypothetical protein
LFPLDAMVPVVHGRPAGRLLRPLRWPAVDNWPRARMPF